MDTPICDTFLTGNKIEHLIRGSNKLKLNDQKLENIDASLAAESEGYTSKLLRVDLTWTGGDSDSSSVLPRSVLIKVIEVGKQAEVFASMPKETLEALEASTVQSHDIECSVYGLRTLADKIPVPKCYGFQKFNHNSPGVLIMENLSTVATSLPHSRTIGLGFSAAQLDHLLDALASVHAWSINTEEDWRLDIPRTTDCKGVMGLVHVLLGGYDSSAEACPEFFQRVPKSKFQERFTLENYTSIIAGDPREKYGLPSVLVHGDIHGLNMLFERKGNNGEAGDRLLALIDWQVAHQGCALEDLIRVFTLCMSAEQRREQKESVLKRYTQLFNDKIEDAQKRITYEVVKKAFDEMYSFAGTLWICFLGFQESFVNKLKGTDEEKEAIGRRMTENTIAIYEECIEILGWR